MRERGGGEGRGGERGKKRRRRRGGGEGEGRREVREGGGEEGRRARTGGQERERGRSKLIQVGFILVAANLCQHFTLQRHGLIPGLTEAGREGGGTCHSCLNSYNTEHNYRLDVSCP